ncbi:hypothetical protein [Candidatus Hodgkinia cicadicola]
MLVSDSIKTTLVHLTTHECGTSLQDVIDITVEFNVISGYY